MGGATLIRHDTWGPGEAAACAGEPFQSIRHRIVSVVHSNTTKAPIMAQGESSEHRTSIRVKGGELVDKVRSIIEEGNARRILIRKEGRTVMEFPLSVGVGGATAALVLAPTLAAIGAFAALVSEVEVVIERPPDADAREAVMSKNPSSE